MLTGLLAFAVMVIEEALRVLAALERASPVMRSDNGHHRGHQA